MKLKREKKPKKMKIHGTEKDILEYKKKINRRVSNYSALFLVGFIIFVGVISFKCEESMETENYYQQEPIDSLLIKDKQDSLLIEKNSDFK